MIIEEFKLIGLTLPKQTTNRDGQSQRDCGNLWHRFIEEDIAAKILNKIDTDTYAVYYNYESDHEGSFSYFIGCKVSSEATLPPGLTTLTIPQNTYRKFIAKGIIPECIVNKWRDIWNSDLIRSYEFDFEKYGEESRDWSNAKIDIYISTKKNTTILKAMQSR